MSRYRFFSITTRILESIKQIIIANLESSGIITEKLTTLRLLQIILALGSIVVFTIAKPFLSITFVWSYAIVHFLFRHIFLFTSFTPTGIAYQLKKRFGENKAAEIYEFFTAFSFFHRSYSYVLLIEFTAFQGIAFLIPYQPALQGIGNVLGAIGIIINTWCFLIIKRDTYYYMDMFWGKFLVEFKQEGPYEIMKNPMYSLGQLPSYGAALALFSIPGLIFTLLNQICCYLFYYNFELPHIKRLLAEEVTLAVKKI